jgi:glycosyltransferase involved in cell wall biosynthesis
LSKTLRLNLSRRTIEPTAGEDVWDAREIARRLRGMRALQALQTYQEVRLCVDNVDELLSQRPLAAARLIARGRAVIEDARGATRTIGWGDLARAAGAMASGALRWPGLRAAIERDLAEIEQPAPAPSKDGGEGVLAVRTDLWFGLDAGGAAAHSAGVLNALAARGPLRLITSHALPMLSGDIAHVVPERGAPLSRAEWTLLAYNLDVLRACAGLTAPRLVYQRHGLYGYAGALAARRWGVPLVLEYNGSEIWIGDHWGKPVAARDMALRIERAMLSCANVVTAVSRPAAEQAIERGAARERVLLSPNAVDVAHYAPSVDGAPVRARYGLGQSLVIGFIGTFGPWHGASLLAQAFGLARELAPGVDVRLLMIGDGPDLPAARAAVRAAGLEAMAVFTGLAPQIEGAAHLAAADILVSPTLPNPDGSPFFGSPTKLFEYMAMGKAIVSSDMAQMAEILAHDRTALLTAPGDVQALAQALARLVHDSDLRARLGAAARQEAETRHQWRHRVIDLENALACLP